LRFQLFVSIAIRERVFAAALAFFTNQFAFIFDDITLSVAVHTHHFRLLIDTFPG
jgi:hypothetical protein